MKKVLLILMSFVLLMSFAGCGGDDNATVNGLSVSVGNIIKFGKYEQDEDSVNGKEDIEWMVLDVQDGKALVISQYGIICHAYNDQNRPVTWETCTLRSWLNTTFISEAFSDTEKNSIVTTNVVAEDNVEKGIDGGNDTEDKIFLLSASEVEKYFSESESSRQSTTTAYARRQGASYKNYDGYSAWLLRVPGEDSSHVSYVSGSGTVSYYGEWVDSHNIPVRPAMWIELD